MVEQIATHALALMLGGTVGALSIAVLAASGRAEECRHAWKLGRECLVRQTDGQWSPMRVVGVTHKGALLVRDAADARARARWVRKDAACDPGIVSFDMGRP